MTKRLSVYTLNDINGETISTIKGKTLTEAIEKMGKAKMYDVRYSLYKVNLSKCRLTGLRLSHVYLDCANLSHTILSNATLISCHMLHANLRGSKLIHANLSNSILDYANLTDAMYQVSALLHQIDWGALSEQLTLELMRRDARIVGNTAMKRWVSTEDCPFEHNHMVRDFMFDENPNLWKPGSPKLNDLQLFRALCREKHITINI